MALLLKNGAVFLHIPKTGGSWATTVLNDLGLVQRVTRKHADMDRFNIWLSTKSYKERFQFAFCFVRYPVRWYESWFRYMSQGRLNWRAWGEHDSGMVGWHPTFMLNGAGDRDFNAFMHNVVRLRPGFATEMMGWFTRPSISFVGKQENLRNDLIEALGRSGATFDEGHILSASPVLVSRYVPTEWDPKLKEEVARLEYAGLVRYGYSLEETLER